MILSSHVANAGYFINHAILRKIKLDLSEGEVVLVTGSSGSGKTTLMYTITGVLKHLLNGWVDGEVRINGVDVLSAEGFERIPSLLKMLMQDPERQLIFPTPLDELMISYEILGFSPEEAYVHSINLLSEIGLRGRESTHVEDLSTGLRKKLAILMLKIGDPSLLLLDEPSANLDPDGIRTIREMIIEWKKAGKGILVTDHKAHYYMDIVDEIYVLRPNGLEKLDFKEETVVNIPECKDENFSASDVLVEFVGSIGYDRSHIVENIEIKARRGELIVVVGPNGSGKTTLLKTLAGSLKPVNGEVKRYTGRIFYAPQNPDMVFIHRSVREELKSTARKSGLLISDLVERYPWYNEVKELSPFLLSHGQRRLLELLIAFSYGKDLVLLDEPTTGLDPQLYVFFIKQLKKHVSKGGSAIVSTLDPRLVLEASRVYIIVNNKLVEADKCKVFKSMIESVGVSL